MCRCIVAEKDQRSKQESYARVKRELKVGRVLHKGRDEVKVCKKRLRVCWFNVKRKKSVWDVFEGSRESVCGWVFV